MLMPGPTAFHANALVLSAQRSLLAVPQVPSDEWSVEQLARGLKPQSSAPPPRLCLCVCVFCCSARPAGGRCFSMAFLGMGRPSSVPHSAHTTAAECSRGSAWRTGASWAGGGSSRPWRESWPASLSSTCRAKPRSSTPLHIGDFFRIQAGLHMF